MTTTAISLLVDNLGHISQDAVVATADGRGCRVVHQQYALPACENRSRQSPDIPVEREHGGAVIGRWVGMERDETGVHAVAEIDDDALDPDTTWYWSPRLRYRADDTDIVVERLAIVERPGHVGARPIVFVPGTVAEAAAVTTGDIAQRLARVRDVKRRRYGGPIEITDVRWTDPTEARATAAPPWARLEHGIAGRVLSVR